MPSTAPDLKLHRTGDGSLTLRSVTLDEQYHSVFGAVNESTHVYIKAGLEHALGATGRDRLDLLEVGLGTGLDLLLTWVRCLEGKCSVRYTALEPHPVSRDLLLALDHCAELAWPGLGPVFMERMTVPREEWWEEYGGLAFRNLCRTVQEWEEVEAYDLVYYDAFAPGVQPEMWTAEVFQRMYDALRCGGSLVTYCSKGEVRRTMQAVGFQVERLAGPPGKREMLRATRPR